MIISIRVNYKQRPAKQSQNRDKVDASVNFNKQVMFLLGSYYLYLCNNLSAVCVVILLGSYKTIFFIL
jgi:hypothetical protein